MKTIFLKLLTYYKRRVVRRYLLFLSLLSFFVCFAGSFFYYKGFFFGSILSWTSWIVGMFSFLFAFLPVNLNFATLKQVSNKQDLALYGFIIALYFVSHLANFSTAPWNSNGLFDDAAWDIYFAKDHVFNGTFFQPAFFDSVGNISREIIFGYYISVFFVLFGYNLLVFNISLLILGLVTVFFTTLLIHKMLNNILVTMLSAIIINFLPLHFMHIFMGHRYAIVAPLMMISLYYLYTGFRNDSCPRAIVSSFAAALCFGSAIMGRQYLYGLAASAIFILMFRNGQKMFKEKLPVMLVWLTGFVIAATPLFVYILCNYSAYASREGSLVQEFLFQYRQNGFYAIKSHFDRLRELLFAKYSRYSQFVPGFYITPPSYYLLIILGMLIAFIRKRFEIIFLSIIPVVGAFISGAYDFRVLLAAPLWVVCIALSLNALFGYFSKRKHTLFHFGFYKYALSVLGLMCILFGLLPSVNYVYGISRNSNSQYLLNHRDVAVSRLIQDIVVGENIPTGGMKWNEFDRTVDISRVPHDTFACLYNAYAVIHLYLQKYDDEKILSFCGQWPQVRKTRQEIFNDNIAAISNYAPTGKDLKLVWETSEEIKDIIKIFKDYRQYGSEETFSGIVDGNLYSVYVLTINNKFIKQFKGDIDRMVREKLYLNI